MGRTIVELALDVRYDLLARREVESMMSKLMFWQELRMIGYRPPSEPTLEPRLLIELLLAPSHRAPTRRLDPLAVSRCGHDRSLSDHRGRSLELERSLS